MNHNRIASLILIIGSALALVVSGLLLAAPTAQAATFTVTTAADSGPGSLRQAILDANASSGTDTITFGIGATGSQQTIAPLTNLPTISDPVILDGWTQGGSGYTGPPLIVIDGRNLTTSSNRGLRITGGATTVRGFVIHSFDDASSAAIWLHTADGNWITGNYIGLSADGTAVLPNHYGIWINNRGNTLPSHNNIVGTNGDGVDDPFEGNTIASSIQEDIRVETDNNWIAGNKIGTNPAGSTAFANNNTGIRLYRSGTTAAPTGFNNVVGTNGDGVSDDMEVNLISGHDYGIGINNSSGHTIAANIIGLDATGSTILGNDFNGIDCNASADVSRDIRIANNTIAGNGSRGFSTIDNGCRHIILDNNRIGTNISGTVALGNGADGIYISAGDWYTITNNIISGNGTNGTAAGILTGNGANHLTITDNIIGSDVNGTADLGNTGDGAELLFGNNYTIRQNQISGNGNDGVFVQNGDTILIEENLVGVQTDGTTALGNDEHGVYIFGDTDSNIVISNTIAYNGRSGIIVASSQANSNTLSANQIFANTDFGIDLGLDGETINDEDDLDTGPNGLQNHPEISAVANTANSVTINGVLDSTSNTTFALEFFSGTICDNALNNQGTTYLGSDTVTTQAGSGNANDTSFSITLPVLVPQRRFLVATATGPEGTSEFSACFGPTGPVQDSPISGLSASNDGPQVDLNPVVLTAAISGGSNVSYAWNPGDGSGVVNGRIITHTYTNPGTYTAVVTATNSVSQETTSTAVIINRSASLSGYVWDDIDGDGAVGPGETTFSNETVRVAQNGLTFTTTTESDGRFLLRGLRSGSYTLFAPSISGYRTFGASIRIRSMPVNGAAISQWLPYHADFTGVRGRAWLDDNFDGRYDSNETLLTNHLITITTLDPNAIFTTFQITTDNDGLYRLNANSAAVGDRHLLSSDTPALYQPITRTLNTIYQAGNTSNLAFRPGAIGGCVSETGGATVGGLTVTLRDTSGQETAATTTDSDGCYIFSPAEATDVAFAHLTPAGSDLIVGPTSQPAVYLGTPLKIDWEITVPGSVLVGLTGVDGVSVSGGESTVSGYELHLATSGGVFTETTNFSGVAHFDNVPPGPITATVPLTGDNIGVYPARWSYNLPAGASIIAPGFNLGTHGVTAECTTPPVPGQEPNGRAFPCTVTLRYLPEATPLITTTLAAGEQFFYQPTTPTNESYNTIITITPDLPNGAELAASDSFFMRRSGSHHFRYPHFLPDQVAPISGELWTDINANGVRETVEGPAIGFIVELLDSSWNVVESTTSDTYGRYQLYPDSFGNFYTRLAASDAILPTTRSTHPVYRDANDLTGDVADFGIALLAEGIEGRVRFSDLGRSNASGVIVELRDPDNNALRQSTITGPTGHFSFAALLPGDYLLRVLPPNGGTAVDRLVTAPHGSTPYQEINLPPDNSRPTVFVFADENGNEVADPGEGLPNVSVAFDSGACGNMVNVNETDSDGFVASERVFPEGGCARITAGLADGLAAAQPDGVMLAPYDGGIISMRVVAEGILQLRPFWDRNGNGQRDANEPMRLDDISVSIGGIAIARSQHALYLTGPAGTYNFLVFARPNSSAVLLRPNQVTGVISSLTENELFIPLGYENTLTGEVVGSNSGAVSGLTIELRNRSNTLIATTTTGTPPVSHPGGRSYTPPPAATGGPAAAPFNFENVAPGDYIIGIANPPANMVSAPVLYGYEPATPLGVRLRLNPIDTISGVVYWDHDYNGRRDNGEPGTQFYDVLLLNDAGLPQQQVTPAADGTFVFTGLQDGTRYALTVPDLYDDPGGIAGNWITASPGWFERGTLATAELGLGNFASGNPNSLAVGLVYLDPAIAREPVAGATVGYYQLQGSAGFCNAANPTILGQTTSGFDGRYRLPLTYIPGGSVKYCLVVLDAPGLVQNDLTVIADAAVSISLPGGHIIFDQALNLDMDIQMRSTTGQSLNQRSDLATAAATVSWSAFRDDNVNGQWDDGEFPLPGVIVGSGAITATSGIDGSGNISLPDGKQMLTIIPPAGYTPVGPETRTVWPAGADVDLPPVGFARSGVASGIVFADKDGDGLLSGSGGEFGLAGVSVTLTGPLAASATTEANGRFTLPNLPDGNYTVSAPLPAGYTAEAATLTVSDGFGIVRLPAQSTTHLTGALYHDWDGDGLRLADEPLASSVPVTVTVDGVGNVLPMGGSILFWDVVSGSYTVQPWWSAAAPADVVLGTNDGGGFGLPAVPGGTVRGVLWLDTNGDSVRQPWEVPLSGITVTLDGGATVVTDGNGRYAFANIAPGSYSLSANLPTGLSAEMPTVSVSEGRGTAVGIPVNTGIQLFLPMITR